MRTLVLLVVTVLCAAAPAAAQAPDAAGKWAVTVTTANGTEYATLVIKKDGETLSGTIASEMRGEMPITGSQKGPDVAIYFPVSTPDGSVDVAMRGKLESAGMRGSVDVNGSPMGEWFATRDGAQAPTSGSGSSDKVDVSGTWLFEVSSEISSGTRTVTFKQDGEKLTGTYAGTYGESPLSGTVTGADVTFAFEVSAEGQSVRVTYSGKVEGDAMKGTFSIGDVGSGTFTAKRK